MSSIIKFLIKQYWAFVLICLLGTILGIFYGGIWNFLPFLFLLLFFYEWNIVPKKDKTWYFFDSLPISFNSKYVIKVIFPFIFSFIIIFLLTLFKSTAEFDVVGGIADGIRISSIFTLSSIFAASLSGFFAWLITLFIVCYLFSFLTFYEIFVAVFCLALSYYYLSEKRVSKVKFVILPIVTAIFIVALASYNRIKVFEIALNIPIHSLQLTLAENLLENKAFIGNNYFVDWASGSSDPFSLSFKVLVPSKYDDNLLEKMEKVFFKNNECARNCQYLADLVSNFPKNWNQDRLLSYLNSEQEAEQIYALKVLDGAFEPIFPYRIMQLTHSPDQQVSDLALHLIKKWGNTSIFQLAPNSVF